MKHPFSTIVNRRIEEAMDAGAFENLPGAGKALDLSKDPFDTLIENARSEDGVTAPIVTLRAEIAAAKKQLETLDGEDRKRVMQQISDLQLRLALELERLKKSP